MNHKQNQDKIETELLVPDNSLILKIALVLFVAILNVCIFYVYTY